MIAKKRLPREWLQIAIDEHPSKKLPSLTIGDSVVEWWKNCCSFYCEQVRDAWKLLSQHGAAFGYPIIHDSLFIQGSYLAMLFDGTSHNLAEMLALQQPPMPNTDREFMRGECNGNQFEGQTWRGDYYLEQANKAEVNVKGAKYMPGLARFPGDPEAWVWGMGDVRKRVEQRGWSCEGALNITGREPLEAPKKAPPAPDIVYDRCLDMIETNPDLCQLAAKKPRELYEKAEESLLPRWGDIVVPDCREPGS